MYHFALYLGEFFFWQEYHVLYAALPCTQAETFPRQDTCPVCSTLSCTQAETFHSQNTCPVCSTLPCTQAETFHRQDTCPAQYAQLEGIFNGITRSQ